MITADCLVRAGLVVTCAGPAPRAGPRQGDAGALARGAVAARAGRIVFVGAAEDAERLLRLAPDALVIDAPDGSLLPGFVDPHTHLVYAGDRTAELRARLAGARYEAIAAAGGGILATVAATRAASEADLVELGQTRLRQLLALGTTTCEIKSGYGLDLVTERKLLRAIAQLARTQPIELVPTFLGAHAVPWEYQGRQAEYVALVVDEMIPDLAGSGLAEWCDVFCDVGYFTPEQARRILEAGRRAGLKPRLHADELAPSGGAAVAVAVGARSADHLVHVSPAILPELARAGVVATLLPAASFFLKFGRYAPARDLVAAGVPVALGTDVNPGGGLSGSMAFAIALACFAMDLTLEEALVAATLNAAYSLDRADRLGSLEVGKQMDALVLRGDVTDLVRVGSNPITHVLKAGRVVFESAGGAG